MSIVEIKTKNEPILFGGNLVIESYKLDELLAAQARGERICDFIYDINAGKVGQGILRKWKLWFCFEYTFRGYTKKANPWAITKGRIYRLWKIWEGLSDEEIKEVGGRS